MRGAGPGGGRGRSEGAGGSRGRAGVGGGGRSPVEPLWGGRGGCPAGSRRSPAGCGLKDSAGGGRLGATGGASWVIFMFLFIFMAKSCCSWLRGPREGFCGATPPRPLGAGPAPRAGGG